MNAIQIRAELDRLRSQVAALQAEQAPFVEARDRALAAEIFNHFRQGDVDNAKRGIERIGREIAAKNERIVSISAHLPTDEQITAAYEGAARLNEQAEVARIAFAARCADLANECATAKDTAERMVEARRVLDHLRSRLIVQRNSFGLEIQIPPKATVPDATLIMLTGTYILQAADGEPADNVKGELDALLGQRGVVLS